MTMSAVATRTRAPAERLRGVDAARGVALLGMMSVHVLPAVRDDGQTSAAFVVASGRAAALFAVLAGVGLALATGGTSPLRGRPLLALGAGVFARAAVVVAVGLVLGAFDTPVAIILVYYGVFFVLAVPFLGLRPRALAALAMLVALTAPVVSHVLRPALPPPVRVNPGVEALADPGRLLAELAFTGYYPAVPWLAYLLAGLAAGRLALRSPRVAGVLVVAGAALALATKGTSWLMLHALGGIDHLRANIPDGSTVDLLGLDRSLETSFYGTTPTGSWWWLAVSAPHSSTPLDLLHTTGTALTVLGVGLLAAHVAGRTLVPLAATGSMTLTLYTAHVVALGQGWGPDDPVRLLLLHMATAVVLATLWRTRWGRGPLERVATAADRSARRAVAGRPLRATCRLATDAGRAGRAGQNAE